MMADTDTYEKIAATYATELREVADEIDKLRRELRELGPDERTWAMALKLTRLAAHGLREKADALDDLPVIARLWIDDQEDQ